VRLDPRWPPYKDALLYIRTLPIPILVTLPSGGAAVANVAETIYFELTNSFSLPQQQPIKLDQVPNSKPFKDVGLWHKTHNGSQMHTLLGRFSSDGFQIFGHQSAYGIQFSLMHDLAYANTPAIQCLLAWWPTSIPSLCPWAQWMTMAGPLISQPNQLIENGFSFEQIESSPSSQPRSQDNVPTLPQHSQQEASTVIPGQSQRTVVSAQFQSTQQPQQQRQVMTFIPGQSLPTLSQRYRRQQYQQYQQRQRRHQLQGALRGMNPIMPQTCVLLPPQQEEMGHVSNVTSVLSLPSAVPQQQTEGVTTIESPSPLSFQTQMD
jgi:hypothetical protein